MPVSHWVTNTCREQDVARFTINMIIGTFTVAPDMQVFDVVGIAELVSPASILCGSSGRRLPSSGLCCRRSRRREAKLGDAAAPPRAATAGVERAGRLRPEPGSGCRHGGEWALEGTYDSIGAQRDMAFIEDNFL